MSDPRPLPVLSAAPVTLRHIKQGAGGTAIIGALFVAQPAAGVNGDRGYQNGTYEPALSEDGTGKVTLPNAAGEDGVLHRRRFLCLSDPDYFPGDEWIEVWQDGRVLFVGTPIEWDKSRSTLTLELVDASGLLPTQREFGVGFWWHAPRDVFENYSKAWRTVVADDFIGGYDGTRWIATIGTGGAVTNQASSVRLTVPTTAGQSVVLDTFGGAWPGVNLITSRAWRAECRYSQALVGSAGVAFIMIGGGGEGATIQTDAATGNVLAGITIGSAISKTAADVTLALERHDRWLFYYAQGTLLFAHEVDWTIATAAQPRVALVNTAGAGVSGYVDLDYIVVRDLQPYLMRNSALDPGDYRLPANPPPGGLRGSYYDEADISSIGDTSATYYTRALSPTKQPYARRQDATINFTSANPPTWQAPGAGAVYFSVRWTGAIYLDLATADVTLRLTSLDNGARLYVGKTAYGQHLLQQWGNPSAAPYTLTSGSLRTHVGVSSGWYPIRLEYAQGIGSGGIILQQSIGGGAYAVVPATSLSPYGIYEAVVRYDSHAEQIRSLVDTFGLQYRVEPRSLESGFFPGEMTPRVRVGRDTEKILEPPESTDVTVKGSARDSAMTLFADAAGLADPTNGAQISAEAIDFAAAWAPVAADRHLAIATGYESLADIGDPGLLQTRLAAMLALRNAPWEEIGARPRGHRQILDSFPLTGVNAAFDWEPGDAVRVSDDQLDLNDQTPRQIIAPAWSFAPDGRGAPTVRFRQRPRSQQDALRSLVRAAVLPQRNYQGQLVVVQGTVSFNDSNLSRVTLPRNLDDIIRAEVVCFRKGDTSTWTFVTYPAGATIATFTTPIRIDVSPYVERQTVSGALMPEMIINATGGTGAAYFQIELLVRV
jgi:hypothetical protein